MDDQSRHADRPVVSWWASWWDGLWLGVGFAIAVVLAFKVPGAVLTWALNAAGTGGLATLVRLVGAAFLLIAGPMILSRVFREIDFPGGGRWFARRPRPDVREGRTVDA